MMIVPLLLIALVVGSQASMVSYEGYKVFRVTPHNARQLDVLANLEKSNKFDVWKSSRIMWQPWDIMVKPAQASSLENLLMLHRISFQVIVENVQDILPKTGDINNYNLRSGRINFEEYQRYDAITSYLRSVAAAHPDTVTLINIGQTSEGRDILGVRISSGGSNNPAILVDCGIHAREWLAPAQGLYIIQELAENPNNAALIANVDWYIIPVLNADGYEYTFTNDNFWRKTRSRGQRCNGVDGNRNFGFHWNEIGASDYECDEDYAGPNAFSEPETRALRTFAESLDNIKLYLSFHSYGSMILYPWGYTSDYPDNADELQSVGDDVADAIYAVRGERYVVGSSTNVLYPAAGGSDDWMLGVRGVPLAYTFELPGWSFQPPATDIEGIVKETFEGIRVYHQYIQNNYVKSN